MCGRYTLTKPGLISDAFGLDVPAEFQTPAYNAAPGQHLPVITSRGSLRLQKMSWGFPASWSGKSQLVINARADSLGSKPLFRNRLHSERCIIPADGFYEWEKINKKKQPYRFILRDEKIFAFAGLYGVFPTENGSMFQAFVIITTNSNELVSGIHDRMPVIMTPGRALEWLENQQSSPESLQPADAAGMTAYKVSPGVNQSANNFAGLIEPWTDPGLTLF